MAPKIPSNEGNLGYRESKDNNTIVLTFLVGTNGRIPILMGICYLEENLEFIYSDVQKLVASLSQLLFFPV